MGEARSGEGGGGFGHALEAVKASECGTVRA